MGLFPESHTSLCLLLPDSAAGLRPRHTGLLSGLAVLFLFIVIVPLVLLCLLRKRGQGRIFPEGKMWKHTLLLPGTEVIYPRWGGEVLCPRGICLPLISPPSTSERWPLILDDSALSGLQNLLLRLSVSGGPRIWV